MGDVGFVLGTREVLEVRGVLCMAMVDFWYVVLGMRHDVIVLELSIAYLYGYHLVRHGTATLFIAAWWGSSTYR